MFPIFLAIPGCTSLHIHESDNDLISQIRKSGAEKRLSIQDSYAKMAPIGASHQYIVPVPDVDLPSGSVVMLNMPPNNEPHYIQKSDRLSNVSPDNN